MGVGKVPAPIFFNSEKKRIFAKKISNENQQSIQYSSPQHYRDFSQTHRTKYLICGDAN